MSSFPWWYRANAKKALESWIRPLITPRPYSLKYEIGEGSYMDFSKREIVIDPTSFPFLAKVLPITWQGKRIDTEAKLQWRIARMAARHEAMHTLFSVPFGCGGTLHYLVNALEDEWMEELAQVFYPKAWGDFVMFARLLARHYPLPDPAKTARSSFFLSMCLYHRWDWKRPKGAPSRIRFHTPEDEQFWHEEIRPLVEKAWKTNVFEERKDIAREILRLLSIPEFAPLPTHGILLPESSFDIKGERGADDTPISVGDESSGISSSKGDGDTHSDEPPHTGVVSVDNDDDEVPTPLEAAEELYLLPPEYLENQVRGEKGRLLRVLKVQTPDATEDAVPYGGEFDVEANLRSDGARPFILSDTPAPAHAGLAIALLIDATGSMGGSGTGGLDERGVFDPSVYHPHHRMTYARQVAMLFELVCPTASITLLIGAAGDDGHLEHLPGMPRRRKPYQPIIWLRTRQTPRDSEVTRAAVAGLYGTYNRECISKSLLEAQRKLAEVSAGTRLIIYIHDGIPTDEEPEDIVRVLKGIRHKGTLVVAPYVGPQSDIGNLQAIFGLEWTLGIEKLPDLSKRLGRLLLKYAQR
jgi:hypothetical protein